MASYFREAYYTFPYYDYISSEPEAGKTTAMKVQTFTSYYGTIASSVTEALLFREIDGSHCFYGLDNIERLFASPKDYSSIIDWLLSSYSRDIPCKRLEKTEEGYEVRYYDGYGIKAFTHIRDFPFALRALRSRCIQIVMQTAKPTKFYPSAEKFTETRDKLYKARLFEFEAVKESYENLINTNILSGRTGDLYLPLLSIAKLVDGALYTRILAYAKRDEVERKEYDGLNIALISVLLEKQVFGSHSTKEIRQIYEDELREKGLLKDSDSLHTRTVTTRLKKLGFQREEKKTENKTWFLIEEKNAISKAYAYGIRGEDKLEKSESAHTPPKPNFPNLSNFGEGKDKPKEGSTEGGGGDKPDTEEIDLDSNGCNEKLGKVTKLAKGGVCESTKNVCDGCGMNAQTTEYNGEWLCSKCLTEFSDNLKEGNIIRPEAFDEDFQTRQDRAARDRLGVLSDE
jgi:ribosomal protein L37AE/L43A